MEQGVNLKFLVKLGKTFTEAYVVLKDAYGNECLSRTQVSEWFKRFKEGPKPKRNVTEAETKTVKRPKTIRAPDGPRQASVSFPQFNKKLELTPFRTLLGNPKDKINNNEKSGIYEISCKDCDQKYIGQTKRSILTRFKDHMAHLKYGRTEKSCVAQHAFDNNHRIDINNLKLIRNVTNSRQLDDFESLEIIKCNNSMNKDNGPIPTSPLFVLINKDSYGSVNRGNKFGINSAKFCELAIKTIFGIKSLLNMNIDLILEYMYTIIVKEGTASSASPDEPPLKCRTV
ncbi:hypothetical protein NQ318_017090 [Aromia moschata]|uniref:GIY-YIG domain-containing protein n=1 Tax=Aromia moschata TaxID=1265417 RepID=A0AAV8Y3F2_9CUCU|nr:hypothetical protein NQ318_017090 [Aromia moschata]